MTDKPIIPLLAAGALLGCASIAAALPDYPTLRLHGDELASACIPEKLDQLRMRVAATTVPDKAQAVQVLETLLCKPDTSANRAALAPLVPAKLRMALAGTGETDKVVTVTRDDELLGSMLPGGSAWDASVQASPNKLVLQYTANEACVKSRSLAYARNKWTIAAIGEACD